MIVKASRLDSSYVVHLLANQRSMSPEQIEMCAYGPHLVFVIDDRRASLSRSKRRQIYDRDGRVCSYCGDTSGPFQIDHVFPLALGGDNSLGNLVVACRSCNSSKRAKTVEEWRA